MRFERAILLNWHEVIFEVLQHFDYQQPGRDFVNQTS
jgi:hypothetical protein